MKIAITGASGFVGRYLVKELIKDKTKRLFLYSRSAEKLESHFLYNENIKFIETDYSSESLNKNFEYYDALIHLGSKRFQKGQNKFSDYLENITVAENLFSACSIYNVTNVVFASTRLVYTYPFNPLPFDENDEAKPSNPYALSKFVCENIALSYNLNVKILRIAQLVGWGEREGYMLMEFIKRALNSQDIILFGKGEGRRDYLYIKDVVDAVVKSINFPETKGIFNIGSGIGVSHTELAQTINSVFNSSGTIKYDESKSEDKSSYILKNNKAKEILGWHPGYTLEEGIRDMRIFLEAENY